MTEATGTDTTTMVTGLNADALQSFVKGAQLFHLVLAAIVVKGGGEVRLRHEDVGSAALAQVQVIRTAEGLVIRATDDAKAD